MPWQARGFYGVIGLAMILGLLIGYSPIDPIQALYWSAVINGVTAVPIMAAMMFVAGHRSMGEFRVGRLLGALGWLSTAVMGAAAGAMIYVALT
jgi:Mn2+/Fe2+ NRAMP family transporter